MARKIKLTSDTQARIVQAFSDCGMRDQRAHSCKNIRFRLNILSNNKL
jgi:hypothetical protein